MPPLSPEAACFVGRFRMKKNTCHVGEIEYLGGKEMAYDIPCPNGMKAYDMTADIQGGDLVEYGYQLKADGSSYEYVESSARQCIIKPEFSAVAAENSGFFALEFRMKEVDCNICPMANTVYMTKRYRSQTAAVKTTDRLKAKPPLIYFSPTPRLSISLGMA